MLPIGSTYRPHPHDITLGYTGFGKLRPVPWHARHRAKHMHVIGATGEGKSKLLETIACDTIRSGLGLCILDPHSDLITDILKNLLSDGILNDPTIRERIVYICPRRYREYVLPMNVLSHRDDPHDTTDYVIEAFKRTWPNVLEEAPRFEQIMEATLPTLIYNNLTLLAAQRLLNNKPFRDACLERLPPDEFHIQEFWHDTFERWGPREAAIYTSSVANKLSKFAFNPITRHMLGAPHNHLDMRAAMDNHKIILVDLWRLPGIMRRLIGGLIVTFIEQAMRLRRTRELYQVIADEFSQWVANDASAQAFADILSESRKMGVGLVASHQQADQLPRTVRSGLKNAFVRVVYSIDWEDAERFSPIVGRVTRRPARQRAQSATQRSTATAYTETERDQSQPYAEQWTDVAESIRSQPERWAYFATRKRPGIPFKTKTIPPYTATDDQVEQIKLESLKRYGIPFHLAQQHLSTTRTDPTGDLDLTPAPLFGN